MLAAPEFVWCFGSSEDDWFNLRSNTYLFCVCVCACVCVCVCVCVCRWVGGCPDSLDLGLRLPTATKTATNTLPLLISSSHSPIDNVSCMYSQPLRMRGDGCGMASKGQQLQE